MGIFGGRNIKSKGSESFDPFIGLEDAFTDHGLFGDIHVINLDQSGTSVVAGSRAPAKPVHKYPRTVRMLAILAIPLCVLGFVTGQLKPWTYFGPKELVPAYFEVRALDISGHPIAGAIVKNDGKAVGTTDSFGEWRQYMRVNLGGTVSITMAKKTANELLFARKNFAVPLVRPDKGEIEIRGTNQLVAVDVNSLAAKNALSASNGHLKVSVPKDAQSNAAVPATASTAAVALPSSLPVLAATAPSTVVPAAVAPAVAGLGDKATEAPKENGPVPFVSNYESIWFESLGASGSFVSSEVLPELVRRAKEVGLRVDPASPWKVRFVSLFDRSTKGSKEGSGLMMVTSTDATAGEGGRSNNGGAREFLRNYQADAEATARGILYILTHHINKNVSVIRQGNRWAAVLPNESAAIWRLAPGMALGGIGQVFNLSAERLAMGNARGYYLRPIAEGPCPRDATSCELSTMSLAQVPPISSWVRLRLSAPGLSKEQEKIFVSGYEASLVGDNLYEYWGQDKTSVNVTVVNAGRVILRSQVFSDIKAPVVLGGSSVSRR
jgi:hypothetical protein